MLVLEKLTDSWVVPGSWCGGQMSALPENGDTVMVLESRMGRLLL